MRSRKNIVLLSLILGNLVEQPTPELNLEQGRLKGRVSTDGRVFEYLGIPYGIVNESNRFQAPYPAAPWEGVYNAVDEHFVCPQIFIALIPLGQEDCLKLNVYAPYNKYKLLPVMVYIHGGGFYEGSGNRILYNPEHFVKKGVVFVTFNYRLAALGFLCLGLKGAPGNAGLKDQLMALRWVKLNIMRFGGDPDNITLVGESAGAGSIAHLKLMPATNGLFKRVITQSGSALAIWAVNTDPINTASLVAEQLGYFTNDPVELLNIYKNTSLTDIRNLVRPKRPGSIEINRVCFTPCIEQGLEGVESIITEPPHEKLTSGNYSAVAILSGFNSREGIALIIDETQNTLEEKEKFFTETLPTDWDLPNEVKDNISRTLKHMYLGGGLVSRDTIVGLSDMYGDYHFISPIVMEADILSKTTAEPQYNYVFHYSGTRSIIKTVSGLWSVPGAAHADELQYIFKSPLLPQFVSTSADRVITERMTTMWTNFAKHEDPTPSLTGLLPVRWLPSDSSSGLRFLHIDTELAMGSLPHTERLRFWNQTYDKFRRKTFKVGVNTPARLLFV